jgi:hypothetical protein
VGIWAFNSGGVAHHSFSWTVTRQITGRSFPIVPVSVPLHLVMVQLTFHFIPTTSPSDRPAASSPRGRGFFRSSDSEQHRRRFVALHTNLKTCTGGCPARSRRDFYDDTLSVRLYFQGQGAGMRPYHTLTGYSTYFSPRLPYHALCRVNQGRCYLADK